MQAARNLGECVALGDLITVAGDRRLERTLSRRRRRRRAAELAADGTTWRPAGFDSGGRGTCGPAEAAGATVGAVTGAALLAVSPGVYTGGSSNTVYSRMRRPRAQFTSTKNVTNGSGIASVERTSRASRPSLPLPTLKDRVDRNGGRSMP